MLFSLSLGLSPGQEGLAGTPIWPGKTNGDRGPPSILSTHGSSEIPPDGMASVAAQQPFAGC